LILTWRFTIGVFRRRAVPDKQDVAAFHIDFVFLLVVNFLTDAMLKSALISQLDRSEVRMNGIEPVPSSRASRSEAAGTFRGREFEGALLFKIRGALRLPGGLFESSQLDLRLRNGLPFRGW
jgi:hypothetical protein